MENYSYSSYPDSRDSSPRSREIDCENQSWDDPPSNYKVKFMCSYGGKIHPRPHDNQLVYVGGDTKILAVDRNIKYSGIVSRLSSLCESEVYFKYQLPGEDLDALISVTNDEDLEHMMLEYDRLYRGSAKPARLRIFLFSRNTSTTTSFGSDDPKGDRQWFVDALNSVPIQTLETASPPAPAAAAAAAPAPAPPIQNNPDFLFGFDRAPPTLAGKLPDPIPEPVSPNVTQLEIPPGSDLNRDDQRIGGDPIVSSMEMQRQIQELQRLQISNQEQAMYKRKNDENQARVAYPGDYFVQKVPEKAPQPSVPVPSPVSVPMGYWQERHMPSGGYHSAPATATGTEQPMYLINNPAGMYQPPPLRPPQMSGQGYYTMQRMVPDTYREQQPVYSVVPPPAPVPAPAPALQPPPPQQQKLGAYPEGMGMVRPVTGGGGGPEAGYTQMAYDNTGRQIFYTTAPGGVMPQYHPMAAATAAPAPVAGTFNQDANKVAVAKVSQSSV